jgi:predicted metal-dependent phosphotriesterase family hydrolase
MTVRGPVDADSLGYTLSHEHLLCDLWDLVHSYDGILDDEALAVSELALYGEAGGRTVVDVTSCGLGRNPAKLRRISEATGLNVVMGAGWYREPVYPRLVYELDSNALADVIVREITHGVDDTGVRAGIIGEIGTERTFITPAQERVFRAAARAHMRTGAAVLTHTTHFGELALEQIALLREEGVPPDRIIISHLGDRIDRSPLLAIARQGVYVSVDNIGYRGDGYPGDPIRAANIRTLIEEGHLHQILLSGDVCMKSHLHAYDGKGYDHVPRCFLPMLQEQGVCAEHVYQMTVANPARALEMCGTRRELCTKAAEAE